MLDLEERLETDDLPTLDLSGRLDRIRVCAERIWAAPRLAWFTDHSASRHSRRVVQLLGGLVEELEQTRQALTRSELYVLLASAYLHDIGMQDFAIDGRGQEDFGIVDYDLVRKRHPERAKELIVNRALALEPGRDLFRLDIDDELQYLLPIALVSQGHGSAFFETTVAEFRDADYAPENVPLRGALLTALLLFADELDLHEDRASFPLEIAQSPLTALHHHLNHYVTRVSVEAGDTTRVRRVRVSFSFPQGSEDYQGDVRLYVASKLARQARRINPILRSETDGHLELDNVVRIRKRTETIAGARRALPAAALGRLRLEMREQQLVGRDELVDILTATLQRQEPKLVELVAGTESDLPAVLSWFENLAANSGVPTTHIDLELAVATESSDLVEALSARPPAEELFEPVGLGLSGSSTLAAVGHAAGNYSVWVLERVDRLLPGTLMWLRQELEVIADESVPVLVILTRSDASDEVVPGATSFELGPLPVEALEHHLAVQFGDDPEEASQRAREAHLLSGGSPSRTLTALAARMNRTWKFDD
ncbi:MAG: hypothetical protein ACLPVY_05230 [Acidimicrobiia bacterium]